MAYVRELLLLAACVWILAAMSRQHFNPGYRCGLCGAGRPDRHGKDCPWNTK